MKTKPTSPQSRLAAGRRHSDRCYLSISGSIAVLLAGLLSMAGSDGAHGADYPQVAGEWNINVASVRIQGRFLLNGRPFPTSFLHGANFFLRNRATSDEVYLELSNNQDFDRRVVPGRYDVVYEHKIGRDVPLNSLAIVRRNLVISADKVFDIDVPAVSIRGAFTVDGAPVPFLLERGLIQVRDHKTGALTALGDTLDQNYSALLIPGTYDLMFSNIIGTSIVPANHLTAFRRDVPILVSGLLNIDVPVISVTGSFTVNGALAPDSPIEAGRIFLLDPDTGAKRLIGTTDNQHYQVNLIPGVYDVIYERIAGGAVMPANSSARFLTGVPLVADATFDIDLPVVAISGDFLVNGAPAPDYGTENARIRLRNGEDVVFLGETKVGQFSVLVVPGTYNVAFEGLTNGVIMPANNNAVLGSVVVAGPSEFDINVPAVEFTADFRFNGGNFPGPAANEVARIYLEDTGTSDLITLALNYPELAEASRVVIPGSYRIRYQYESGVTLPRNQFAVLDDLALARPLHTVVNIRSAPLTGAFTLNGGAFPAGPGENAAIGLESLGSGDSLFLGGTADDGYSTVIIPGRYVAIYNWAQGSLIPRNQDAVVDGARVRKPLGLFANPGGLPGLSD